MRRHWMLLASILMLALLASPSASQAAEDDSNDNPWEMNVSIGPLNQNLSDPSFDLVSGDDWMPLVLVTLEFEIWDDLFVAPAYFYGSSSARLNNRADADFAMAGWELKVRKGFQVLSWLRPYASVTGSYNWYDLEIQRDNGSTLKQEDSFFGGHLGARGALGSELMIPRKVLAETWLGDLLEGFTVGLAFEAGYAWRSTAEFKEMSPDAPYGDAASIPRSDVNLGSMNLSGWFWTLDFRFLF